MASRRPLLLQLCAVAAASSSLLAATIPVDAAVLPPPSSDASSTADAAVSRVARRLGPAHQRLRRVLSDIPTADAPAAAAGDDYDYDIPADAPATVAGGDYEIPAADYYYYIPTDAPATASAAGDYYYVPGDAPAPAAGADDVPAADADAAGHSQWTFVNVFFGILVFFFAGFVLAGLVLGLIKGAALLASAVADLYAAAKTAREKATRVRPVDQNTVEAAGGH